MGGEQFDISETDTIITRVQYLAEKFPDRELFVFYNGTNREVYTSRQLFELAGKFANRLRHRYGFKPNDVIANTLPNSPERLITSLGTTLAECVDMNGQILLADGDDFFQSARKSRCKGVILCPDETSSAWKLVKSCVEGDTSADTVRLSCDRAPEMTSAVLVSRRPGLHRNPLLEDLRTSDEDIFAGKDVTPDDIAVVFTTSGTTGYSKLIPRTHAEMMAIWNAVQREMMNLKGLYNDRPLGWFGGYPMATYLNGEKRVLLDFFDMHGLRGGADMWYAIHSEKCKLAIILPLDLESIVRHVTSMGGANFKLETLICGGQPITKSQRKDGFLIAEQLLVGYGSTESGLITQGTIKDPDAEVEDYYCGAAPEDVSVKILDEEGQECRPRQVGSVFVKGIGVFKGFFNRLEDSDPKTIEAFSEDGYLITEDNGYFDEDRNVYIIGRSKDLIMYGAVVLYPGWLEARIMNHPEVVEACVVPVSDPVRYHNICACVEPRIGSRLTESQLRGYCESIFAADKEAEGTPLPKFYLFMDEFPHTLTGKLDRQALKRMAEEKFGVKERS